MLESHSDDNKEELEVEFESNRSGNQGSFLRREPSFSGWCDENGKLHFEHPVGNSEASVNEHLDFELPSLEWGRLVNGAVGSKRYQSKKFEDMSMRLDGGNTMEDREVHVKESGNGERYVPLDIEDASAREIGSMSNGVAGIHDVGSHEKLPSSSAIPVSAADVLKTLFFILVWYFFSIFLTLYNKTLLGDHNGKFPAPLLMNTVHFSMQAVLSKGITWCWSNRFQPHVAISWRDYFVRVVPTALGTALDVDLSNVSLVFISVTFATMCKSASPIFLLLFAFVFRLESPSFKLLGIIVTISIGVLLTVAKETEFQLWGFVFVMLAAFMSGFRWAMTQILLQKEDYGLKNPLMLMSYVSPIMAISTGLLSLMLDPWYEFKTSSYFNGSWHVALSCLLMIFGGMLAFFMVLTEYVLVSVTSAVTVMIAGVVKEAVTILVAVIYFHEEFTWLMGAGLFTIMIGVSLFNWYKYQKLQKGPIANDAAKYVILEEMDEQDDIP